MLCPVGRELYRISSQLNFERGKKNAKESRIHFCYTIVTRIAFKAVTNENSKTKQKLRKHLAAVSSVGAMNHKIKVSAYTHRH